MRRVQDILVGHTEEEINFAAGKVKTDSVHNDSKRLESFQALALYLDLDLSEEKYRVLRKVVNNMHENCFPTLYALRNLKKTLIPRFTITEDSAEVDLKALMHTTANGILDLCANGKPTGKLSLICKWGMDGSSGHSLYKQKFSSENQSDEFMFMIALVTLK